MNRLNFIREGFFINPSLNIFSPEIGNQWCQKTIFNESFIVDRRTEYPLIFLAFGWVSSSNLQSHRLDIEPVQPDWKSSMNNLATVFSDYNMIEYCWEDIPAPGFSSVRFGAPQEHTYQGELASCLLGINCTEKLSRSYHELFS